MEEIFRIESISQLNTLLNRDKLKHPQVCIVDLSAPFDKQYKNSKIVTGFYSVFLKGKNCSRLRYGHQNYDFEEGTMVFIGPEQVVEMEDDDDDEMEEAGKSWGLFFHPDLLKGTSLSTTIKSYSFFSYNSNEALHLSDKEREIVSEIIDKINYELSQNIDKHTQTLIVSNIELLLNYCSRFYDRQFITRSVGNIDILSRFESFLSEYYQSGSLKEKGLPTVKMCADKLNLTPNYLSDLLKKETGKNAREHIQYFLIEEAKNKLLISNETISQIAFALGFEYPQHFSKVFKKHTGYTPVEYRNLN
ncbi:MAG: AraC family transcriptional regulator [Bacteroidales bacterium]|nr:AraC family transcriptional regulator [Bacteroidales bacterium]